MPLKAPAEKAILGANQFKFSLSHRKIEKAFCRIHLPRRRRDGSADNLLPSMPKPSLEANTHRPTVFETLIRSWRRHIGFCLEAIECDDGRLHCEWRIFSPEMRESGPMPSSHASLSHARKHLPGKSFLYIRKYSSLTCCLTRINRHALEWAHRSTQIHTATHTHTHSVLFACWLRLSGGRKDII